MNNRFQEFKTFGSDESIPVPINVACCPNCGKRFLAEPISWDRIGDDGPRYRSDHFMLSCESQPQEDSLCFSVDDKFYFDVYPWLRSNVVIEFSGQELSAVEGYAPSLPTPEKIEQTFRLRESP